MKSNRRWKTISILSHRSVMNSNRSTINLKKSSVFSTSFQNVNTRVSQPFRNPLKDIGSEIQQLTQKYEMLIKHYRGMSTAKYTLGLIGQNFLMLIYVLFLWATNVDHILQIREFTWNSEILFSTWKKGTAEIVHKHWFRLTKVLWSWIHYVSNEEVRLKRMRNSI